MLFRFRAFFSFGTGHGLQITLYSMYVMPMVHNSVNLLGKIVVVKLGERIGRKKSQDISYYPQVVHYIQLLLPNEIFQVIA